VVAFAGHAPTCTATCFFFFFFLLSLPPPTALPSQAETACAIPYVYHAAPTACCHLPATACRTTTCYRAGTPPTYLLATPASSWTEAVEGGQAEWTLILPYSFSLSPASRAAPLTPYSLPSLSAYHTNASHTHASASAGAPRQLPLLSLRARLPRRLCRATARAAAPAPACSTAAPHAAAAMHHASHLSSRLAAQRRRRRALPAHNA